MKIFQVVLSVLPLVSQSKQHLISVMFTFCRFVSRRTEIWCAVSQSERLLRSLVTLKCYTYQRHRELIHPVRLVWCLELRPVQNRSISESRTGWFGVSKAWLPPKYPRLKMLYWRGGGFGISEAGDECWDFPQLLLITSSYPPGTCSSYLFVQNNFPTARSLIPSILLL